MKTVEDTIQRAKSHESHEMYDKQQVQTKEASMI